ncbi:hypothetical protein BDN72DRAFT_110967 [Pluteus cervinus]|uniref:Uncharacterized protein n=1 Tax=Pluteus cervinus TaxID=181527 RepID=A0ACD3AMV5_9AGAR|nr:hypothetical protein BDN72DRAFT_110967 [Pluteus cervinus]
MSRMSSRNNAIQFGNAVYGPTFLGSLEKPSRTRLCQYRENTSLNTEEVFSTKGTLEDLNGDSRYKVIIREMQIKYPRAPINPGDALLNSSGVAYPHVGDAIKDQDCEWRSEQIKYPRTSSRQGAKDNRHFRPSSRISSTGHQAQDRKTAR